jgi:Secretion system C-terminal sorting domain
MSCMGGYAQLQNANWQFGNNAGLTFLPDPYSPQSISSAIDAGEGCASVSDQQGNLLFYTNGIKVWRANNTVMPNGNGLLGNTSSTQNAVIVPKPGSVNYYIFTIDGITGNLQGLHYSEVNMTTNDVIPAVKNIPLKDHNNVNIVPGYLNNSEKITSARHSNGTDYWIVAQIRDKIYSYLVSSGGVTLTPVSSNAPVALPLVYGDYLTGAGQMKISPLGKHIAIAYNDGAFPPAETGVVALGSFDSNTGQAIFSPTLIQPVDGPGYYGLEFSPKSNYLYFNIGNDLYRGSASSAIAPVTLVASPIKAGALQLAINGKIYISNPSHFLPTGLDISVINDPDDAIDPDVQANTVDIAFGVPSVGLPQWVHWHPEDCLENVTFTIPELNFVPYTHSYQEYIITTDSYSVHDNQDITMRAGDYILMQPNTYIMPGSVFHAYIEDCSESPRPGREENKRVVADKALGLALYPNPSNDIVNLELNGGTMQHINIISLDGKTIADRDIENAANYSFDVKEYSKGIYIVTIRTTDGKMYTEKLVVQ